MELSNFNAEMIISNLNLKVYIRALMLLCFGFVLVDVTASQLDGSLSNIFKGYSIVIIPVLVIAVYSYIGKPLFHFDGESELLHIKNNFSFSSLFGKELFIQKDNVESFIIDASGLRKKLIVKYIKDGREQQSTFSISLLSEKKIQKLSEQIKQLQTELKKSNSQHLFI